MKLTMTPKPKPEADLARLLGARIRVARVPREGRPLRIEADPEAREAIATRLGVLGVDRFAAGIVVAPFRGGLRVTGELDAVVRQQCVVTLEPVAETVHERIDRVFLEQASATDAHVFVDPEAEDEPDWFDGEVLDLSPLLMETLALCLDPYPRAPGARLEQAPSDLERAEASPFAALKSLKRPSPQR